MRLCCRSLTDTVGWLVLCVLHGALSIKITDIRIPRYIVKGGQVTLRCAFDSEGSEIYAIKWYKDRQEFYRYLPQSDEPKRAYNVTGFQVSLNESTDSEVALHSIGEQAAGTYKCEISGEGPNFWTAAREQNVSVAALPERQPEIWGQLSSYRPGQNVSVNCTAHGSSPPAHVNWFVNGEQVSQESMQRWLTPDGGDLFASTAGLRLTARRQHFKEGRMRLQCAVTVGDVYWDSAHLDLPLWPDGGRGARSGRPAGSGGACRLPLTALLTFLVSTYWSVAPVA